LFAQISFAYVEYKKEGYVILKGLFLKENGNQLIILNPNKKAMFKLNVDISNSTPNLKYLEGNSKIEFCGFLKKRELNKDGGLKLIKIRPLIPSEALSYYDGELVINADQKLCSNFDGL
jgi:hypothetical protein